MKPTLISGVWLVFGIATSSLLTACGGGGGDSGSNVVPAPTPAPVTTPVPTPTPAPVTDTLDLPANTPVVSLAPDCAGNGCSASSANNYSGSGVGTWVYQNNSNTPVAVDVNIQGAVGKNATLILSNLTTSPASMYTLPLQSPAAISHAALQKNADMTAPVDQTNHVPAAVVGFQPPALISRAGITRRAVTAGQTAAVGDTRSWYDANASASETPAQLAASTHAATLRQQLVTSDGTTVNLWVEDAEYGSSKVSDAIINKLVTTFAGSQTNSVYNMVTSLAGQPWGTAANGFANLIGPSQPIDIVILNLSPDQSAYGELGYFYARNNYLQSAQPFSNQSLSFYMDSETLYLAANGVNLELSTLAHEFTHMIDFYQRFVVSPMGYSNQSWLEEMLAMGMEDIVDSQIDTQTGSSYSAIRDSRFPSWLAQGGYNCPLPQFSADTSSSCFSYSIGGSFMGYLLRQYGISSFYQTLLRDKISASSSEVLDDAIKQAGGLGLADALRRWHTSAALLPASGPNGFGYPERQETINGLTYTLVPIDGSSSTSQAARSGGWPRVEPATLQPMAMFPTLRNNLPAVWQERVAVPANTTLSIVIQ